MSLASKITLGASAVTTIGIIYLVQAKQCSDRERMHEGVVRDRENQNRKAENIRLLHQQEELAKALRKENDEEEVILKILAGEKNGKTET